MPKFMPENRNAMPTLALSSPEYKPVHPEKLDKKFEKIKWEILEDYVHTGSFLKTAKKFGLEQRWIKGWAVSEEGKEFIEEKQAELRQEVQAELLSTARKATEKAQERLESGNIVILKDGSEVTKPVDAGEASAVASRLLDAKNKIEKNIKEANTLEKREQIISRLLKVQQQLIASVTKPAKVKRVNVIDVEAVEVPAT